VTGGGAAETVTIEGIGLTVSRVGLGTWAIGGFLWGGTDEEESVRTIRSALERGINLVDTAPAYGFGRSEEIVGRALAEGGLRDRCVIATKVGLDWSGGGIVRNSSPEWIRREAEDSLRRLRTDRIDLYQVHWPDPRVPIEDTAEAMHRLHREGKIRAIGVSNFTPAQMERFREAAPLHAGQPPYNLFERESENEVIPWCRRNGVAVLAYGALCRGLLTGKMRADTRFEGDDLRNDDPKFRPPRFESYLEAASRLERLARERFGRGVTELAVRWILDRGADVALWGARRPDQLDAADAVFGWSLDRNALEEIDRILDQSVPDPVGPEFMAPPPVPGS
jgi:aryl-alcohol dehydrogenase-like predicted oxidoreductase